MQLVTAQIINTDAWKEIFTIVPLGSDHVVATYYGTFVYDNLSVEASRHQAAHWEGVLVVPVKGFVKWGMGNDLTTPSGRLIWVLSAPFSPASFIDCQGYRKDQKRRPNSEQLAANPNPYGRPNISF